MESAEPINDLLCLSLDESRRDWSPALHFEITEMKWKRDCPQSPIITIAQTKIGVRPSLRAAITRLFYGHIDQELV